MGECRNSSLSENLQGQSYIKPRWTWYVVKADGKMCGGSDGLRLEVGMTGWPVASQLRVSENIGVTFVNCQQQDHFIQDKID